MSSDWSGVPLNPERDGAHRLRHEASGLERDALWLCGGTWLDGDGQFSTPHAATFYHYLGPLILSADHAAAVEAAVQAERDACRAEAADEKRNWSPDGVAATACEAIDRRIRARGRQP